MRSARPIPRIAPPSPDEFARRWVRRGAPVIIEDLARDWPALRRWSDAYLNEHYGDIEVTTAGLVDGALDLDVHRGLLFQTRRLGEVIDAMPNERETEHGSTRYVIAPADELPLAFHEEFEVPRLCAGAPFLRVKVWYGPGGHFTPTHCGAPENLFVLIRGEKRFTMFPPRQTPWVYPHAPWSKLPNFARVDPEAPDYGRHPLFRFASGHTATLKPGDALFIPRLWWHHVATPVRSLGVNFWWSRGVTTLLSVGAMAAKKLRGLSV